MNGFRCLAEGRDGAWSALCVDLDIAADGRSFAEARANLERAIGLYLERVAELPEVERRQFLNRKAPWHRRAKFALLSLIAGISPGGRGPRSFTVSAHA
jgi:predicted RNase H-like HicB family nuclease